MTFSLTMKDAINEGDHVLTVISSSLGIDNYNGIAAGYHPDQCDKKGLTGNIAIMDSKNKVLLSLTDNGWYHYIGLTGERLDIYGDGMNKVQWVKPPMMDN